MKLSAYHKYLLSQTQDASELVKLLRADVKDGNKQAIDLLLMTGDYIIDMATFKKVADMLLEANKQV